jgi:chemotaxis protein CheC
LSALNEFLGMLLLISVPTLVFDIAGAILSTITGGLEDVHTVICVETRFMDDQENLGGYFILAPDPVSLRAIFRAIKVK